MAIPTNIKTLLSGEVVEWARIEFKETWDPAASLKTVCAFANDLDNWGGGYIVMQFIICDDVLIMEKNGSYFELEKVGEIQMFENFL